MKPSLLRQRRFGPFFWTQALTAFNDNVYKQALLILITYQGIVLFGLEPARLNNLAALIFILPFFLFSAAAGQIAEKFEKSMLIRRIKAFEVLVMLLAALAFHIDSISLLLALLFLMGTQSAFFGPIKYSILPQILDTSELVRGNGQVSMGTFVAILLGSLLGGALVAVPDIGWLLVSGAVVLFAALGYLVARRIPPVPATAPELELDPNLLVQTWRLIGFTRENRAVFLSILGVSWFWFFGSVMLPQLPPLVKDVLRGNEAVAIAVFTLFSVGIGAGSLLCAKLSFRRVEIGLVPLGALGMSGFGVDLHFAALALAPAAEASGPMEFLGRPGALRVLADVLLLGVAGGLYIVPLNALIQHRSLPEHRSRVVAGMNVINALAMVVAGAYAVLLLGFGLSVLELVLLTAIVNLLVAAYIFALLPEFLLRFAAWVLVNTIYRVQVDDLRSIPDEGGVLLVCNHVSFADALVIGGSAPRPVRFVMDHRIHRWPLLGAVFRLARTIPICSRRDDPEVLERAFDQIAAALGAGELVCIFPEGSLSPDGSLQGFRSGVQRIVDRTPVPVLPMALSGLWGSWFSRSDGGVLRGPPRRFLGRIRLRIGELVPPGEVSAADLRERVRALLESAA